MTLIVEAHCWKQNGDHPNDQSVIIYPERDKLAHIGWTDDKILRMGKSKMLEIGGEAYDRWCYLYATDNDHGPFYSEGKVVRRYRHPPSEDHPERSGQSRCAQCGHTMHMHGWMESEMLNESGKDDGETVCPGDMVITHGVLGEHTYSRMSYPQFHRAYRSCNGLWNSYVPVDSSPLHPDGELRSHLRFRRHLLQYEIDKRSQNATLWLARHLPKKLRYWVVIVETADYSAKHGDAIVPEINAMDLLED